MKYHRSLLLCQFALLLSGCSEKTGNEEEARSTNERGKSAARDSPDPLPGGLDERYFNQSSTAILADLKPNGDPGTNLEIIRIATKYVSTIEEYKRIFDELESLGIPENQKFGLLRNATAAASKNGLAKQLIDFLNENIGPGRGRERYISTVFSNSRGSPPLLELAGLARNLETHEEVAIALRAISSSIAHSDISELYDFAEATRGDPELTFTIGKAVSEKFAYEEFMGSSEMDHLKGFIQSNANDGKFIEGLLHLAGDSIIRILWPEMMKNGKEWEGNRAKFLHAAATREPADTFQKLAEWSQADPNDIGLVVGIWLRHDPIAATGEIGKNRRLAANPSLHDRAALEIVNYAIAHNEIETARIWASSIKDSERRSQAIKAIPD